MGALEGAVLSYGGDGFSRVAPHSVALLTRNRARIDTFLNVAKTGMPLAHKVLHEGIDNYLSNLEASNSSSGDNTFADYVKKVGSAAYAEDQVHDAQSAVDAAALVFMHAVVDDCAMASEVEILSPRNARPIET